MKEIKKQQVAPKEKVEFVFKKVNYIIFFIGLALMILGYVLMTGGGSDDPNVFNSEMFDFRRISLSPILIVLGIIVIIISIFYKGKNTQTTEE